ncbi:MAG TPA: prepilin-type N-terminal cleavage/methylation domain-containing protein [Planctomycetota bacterium]|nr:prepilin-type N-terminal cleavage/methylation domain-containing protein [Planctomycetota bacterium]
MRPRHHTPRRSRAGFTFLEVMIAVTLLAVIAGSAALVGRRGTDAFRNTSARTVAEAEARRAIGRIAQELQEAMPDTVSPVAGFPAGSDTLDFRRGEDFVAGAVVLSDLCRIELRPEPGEADNGADDDGDGLVDECIVVLVKDVLGANEQEAVLARNVRELGLGEVANGLDDDGDGLEDEPGFCLVVVDEVVRLWLSVEHVGAEGERFEVAVETSVEFRN